jgi:hypothetical protein
MSKTEEVTQVSEVEFDNLDDLLGPGADSIMVPQSEEKKTILSSTQTDTTFLDNAEKKEESQAETAKADETSELENEDLSKTETTSNSSEDLDEITKEIDLQETEEKNTGGRPKLDKNVMVSTASKLIEKGMMFPFDDEKNLEDYTEAEWEELLIANFEDRENRLQQEVPKQFFQSLPKELQHAYEYIAQGGTDLKGMFKALASAREVTELDIESIEGQEQAIRAYYQATNFGTPEEIEEEIESLKDRDELETRAQRYKPRLDKMEEQYVQQKVQQQAQAKAQQEAQAKNYQDSIYNVLAPGELNGVTLDSKTQNMLFAGLVQPNYPSVSGKPTTMLGHLLEKYQWVEPNHELIAETLWLLSDPEGYKSKIREHGGMEKEKEVVRQLKYEQSSRNSSSVAEEKETSAPQRRTISKKKRNFFERK